MGASTGGSAVLPPEDYVARLDLDHPLLSTRRSFCTTDYATARNYIETSTAGLFDLFVPNAEGFVGYDVRTARLGGTVFDLVRMDCESGYRIEMREDPDLILLHILMRG